VTPEAVIRAKRDGRELDRETLEGFVRGFLDDTVCSYRMSAFLMAVYFRGMTRRETADLTRIMVETGQPLYFPDVPAPKVDKHSTGGVGDWVSLPLAPLAAACGVAVPMVAGRGLGYTGGTIDKLESIPGFRTSLSAEDFQRQLANVGCAIGEQTAALAPADRRMYALRDVTATVESIPLIVSSILSKKAAEGIQALVLDVKCGRGAFMKTETDALELAESLVSVGTLMGLRTVAFVTDMDLPLGTVVGNAIEVEAALEFLNGRGPREIEELVLTEGAALIALAFPETPFETARDRIARARADGSGRERFEAMVQAQGGDLQFLPPGRLPRAGHAVPVPAPAAGWVVDLDPVLLARAVVELGGGRRNAGDAIDPSVGVEIRVPCGSRAAAGEPLAVVHAGEAPGGERVARELVGPAFRIGASAPERGSVIRHLVTATGSRAWSGPVTWSDATGERPRGEAEAARSGERP
jgi:pyrimidine-nucleoside phosphorylase